MIKLCCLTTATMTLTYLVFIPSISSTSLLNVVMIVLNLDFIEIWVNKELGILFMYFMTVFVGEV